MLNESPLVTTMKSDSVNGFPKRQQTQSLPCIPPHLDRWFNSELEKRGIDPIVFGPTALFNLMQQYRPNTQNVSITERYSTRVRVIEMLLDATNGSNSPDDISHLIDQVDLRLRQSETSLDYRCSEPGPPNSDEGFLEWSSCSKGPAAAAVQIPAPVEHPEHPEEEGELLLNEVSDMLEQFNLEVRRGDVDGPKEGAKASKKPSAGIPAVLGTARKRDESIDSGCSSFNWSSSRDSSNDSSPPSALDWLSVSPGGTNSIWSSPSMLSSSFGTASSVSAAAVVNAGRQPSGGNAGAGSGVSGAESSWYQPQMKARMRLTSAPSFIYVDDDLPPELVRHRPLGPVGKKKHKGAAGVVSGKAAKHHGVHHHHGQGQVRQASPPSDSGGSSPSSGGSSPPVGASVAMPLSGVGKSSLEKSRRACSFYLRGHCKKEDCEFAHDLTKVTCKFWMTGECFKGETCPFLHGQPRSA